MGRLTYLASTVSVAVLFGYLLANVGSDIYIVFLLFALAAHVILAWLRADNAGKSNWWAALAGVPLVGFIAVIYLLIVPPKHAASS